jgi:hypothetical protein
MRLLSFVIIGGIVLLVAFWFGPGWWGQFHYWLYFGKGDEATKTQAISAGVQALAAVILLVVTAYYAFVTRRALEAAKGQTEAAKNTLALLLREKEEQRRIDISTVSFQLEAAIHMIDGWLKRIDLESFDLPNVIEMRPTNFSSTIANADRIDHIVAGYMGAALLFVTEAETDVRVIRDKNPAQQTDSPLAMAMTGASRERLRKRASENLEVARFKLGEAKARLKELAEGDQHRTLGGK